MGWTIKCIDGCGNTVWATNIVDLISHHRDPMGWFLCSCGKHGYIEKKFDLQEPGQTWSPYLRGIIPLGAPGDTYQPFVFMVSDSPIEAATDIWFSYYKDLRSSGGRLKLGYRPGGPPVLGKPAVLQLLGHLIKTGCFSKEEIANAL